MHYHYSSMPLQPRFTGGWFFPWELACFWVVTLARWSCDMCRFDHFELSWHLQHSAWLATSFIQLISFSRTNRRQSPTNQSNFKCPKSGEIQLRRSLQLCFTTFIFVFRFLDMLATSDTHVLVLLNHEKFRLTHSCFRFQKF